jgi:ADP-heptose:LPS heptosyltransferase
MHILVIRPGAIGDTLLALPVIQALREQHNSSHITLVGNATVLPLARASGIVDEVYDYQEARWSYLFLAENNGCIRDVKLYAIVERTQLAICWLRDPDGIVERNLRTAGIQQVIVAPGRPDPSATEATHITTYLAKTIGLTWQKPLNEICLSLPHIPSSTPGRDMPIYPSQRNGTTVGVHVGSGGAHKCWPIERFIEVIYYLWQRQSTVLILGGPAEEERLARLRRLLHSNPQPGQCEYLINAPLLTVAQRLELCQCYLGNDSGLTHLAAMLGLPTLALFGPSNPMTWHPPGPSVTVLHEPVLGELSVETVVTGLGSLLT